VPSPISPSAQPPEISAAWLRAMRSGDWEAAWRLTDRIELPRRERERLPGFERHPHELVWNGTPFEDRVVRVRCLHGLGDTLQFLRFVPLVAARARALHLLVQPACIPLLNGLPGLGQVSTAWTDHPPDAEVEIEVMELAYALRATPASVPPPYPHLAARAQALCSLILPQPAGHQRVGLLWAASDWDRTRSLPLQELEPLLAMPGLRFYSLQQGDAANDPRIAALGITPLSRHTEAIECAASAMLAMDRVVAVDGMPAHLAGTLGRPTWLLLKNDADWRWGDTARTPWYSSVHLLRQRSEGDWRGVVARLVQEWELRSS
jgi:hypothetical protein